jgi:flagella basal body P-ring formation protein FlgA
MKCLRRSTTSRGSAVIVAALILGSVAALDAGTLIDNAAVREAVVAAVRGRMGNDGEVRVGALWVPAGHAEPSPVLAAPEPGARLGQPARFSLSSASSAPAPSRYLGYAVASLTVVIDHTRVTRDVRRGAPITADDIAGSREEVRDVWLRRLPLPDEVVGAMATRDLRAGQVIESNMVAVPPMVRTGDLVAVRVRVAGIEVSGRARASEQGRHGAVIRLVNVESGRRLRGRVVGPGEVEVVR